MTSTRTITALLRIEEKNRTITIVKTIALIKET